MEHSPILQAFRYVGVPVFTIASDGSVSHGNTAADNMFGYTNDSMTGQKISHLLPVESVAELHIPPLLQNPKVIVGYDAEVV
jgi:PAS domain S-box-containing protein